MRVLIGCECSGVVREAFRARGHDAWSCDLKPADDGSPYHIQGDVLYWLRVHPSGNLDENGRAWDLLIIHPPCTDLTVSCSRLWKQKQADGRQGRAVAFFMACVNAPVPKICVENPVGAMSKLYRKANQYVQPYDFGDDASKRTGLWLKGLPPLFPTRRFPGRMVRFNGEMVERWSNQTDSGQNRLGPSETRAAQRSVTYRGIAQAMAQQWG